MGASFSSSSPSQDSTQTLQVVSRKKITHLVEDGYLENNHSLKSKKTRDLSNSMLVSSKKPKASRQLLQKSLPKNRIQILENQMVTLNTLLLFAKFSFFPDMPSRILFANSVTNAIISYGRSVGVPCIYYGERDRRSYTFACRFLQITVTDNNDFFLSGLGYKFDESSGDWICGLFDDPVSREIHGEILTKILAIVKREKQLINKPGTMTFCIDFFYNRRSRTNSTNFHQDFDFSGTFFGTPSYTCTMTTSNPEAGYGV